MWDSRPRTLSYNAPFSTHKDWEGLITQVEEVARSVGELAWCLGQPNFPGPDFRKFRTMPRNPKDLSPKELLKERTADAEKHWGALEHEFKICRRQRMPEDICRGVEIIHLVVMDRATEKRRVQKHHKQSEQE